jgi:hypothetical protein
MPSNSNWVCFDCHLSIREPSSSGRTLKCLRCGGDCFNLGRKVAIPKKGDTRAWRKLHLDCRERQLSSMENRTKYQVHRIHSIERRVAKLKQLPASIGREKLIQNLESQLQIANVKSP